jgi:hypothetical protein
MAINLTLDGMFNVFFWIIGIVLGFVVIFGIIYGLYFFYDTYRIKKRYLKMKGGLNGNNKENRTKEYRDFTGSSQYKPLPRGEVKDGSGLSENPAISPERAGVQVRTPKHIKLH